MRVVVVLMMVGSLFGCGGSSGGSDGSDPSDAQLTGRADATRSAATETFAAVGAAVEAVGYSSTGGGQWDICGMDPSPSGAEYVAEVAITQTNIGSSEYAARIEKALTTAGWTLEDTTDEAVTASKDGLDFRARYGRGAINLSIASGCVDTSKDTAHRLTDEPRKDLGLSL